MTTKSFINWFEYRINKHGPVHPILGTECWLWTGKTNRAGYGRLYVPYRSITQQEMAHRVSYMTYIGPITYGNLVLHRCDNPTCVRPDHLFLGTYADNSADMVAKNRQSRKGRPKGLRHLLLNSRKKKS